MTVPSAPFKARHREMQELVRELAWLRRHNLAFEEGDPQDGLLMIAEGAVTLISIERFLRILLEHHGIALGEDESVYNLLQRATAGKRPLIRLPVTDRELAIKQITAVRNSLLHGNYEQAAARAGAGSVGSYFGSQFAAEVEGLVRLLDLLMQQIDAETGMPLPL